MKKVLMSVFVVFAFFMFVACGDADPKPASIDGDENEVSDDEGGNTEVDDGETENDSEVVPEPDDEAATSDEETGNDDDPGESTEDPDETETPQRLRCYAGITEEQVRKGSEPCRGQRKDPVRCIR